MTHNCEAVIVTCIDFRIQEYIDNWIRKKFRTKNHDRVALAGGVKDFETILKQVETSKRLHHIKKVVLVNHEDCGAYGKGDSHRSHVKDLNETAKKLRMLFNNIQIQLFYLHLNGIFEQV